MSDHIAECPGCYREVVVPCDVDEEAALAAEVVEAVMADDDEHGRWLPAVHRARAALRVFREGRAK
jgi:hypothetical protein